MVRRRPIITDPAHLADAAGTAYVCVRPSGEVAEAFDRMQGRIRDVVGEDRASWPAAHMTLHGFGSREHPLDAAAEHEIASFVERWAGVTRPLELRVDGIEVFAEERIPIVRIRGTEALGAAIAVIRSGSARARLTPNANEAIPVEDWVFHLSLVYYDDDRWSSLDAAVRDLQPPAVSCVAGEVELVGFDGGPERLLGRFPLLGRP